MPPGLAARGPAIFPVEPSSDVPGARNRSSDRIHRYPFVHALTVPRLGEWAGLELSIPFTVSVLSLPGGCRFGSGLLVSLPSDMSTGFGAHPPVSRAFAAVAAAPRPRWAFRA